MTSSDSLADFREAVADRYTVGDPVGSGAMATVYAAIDRRTDQRVAIKVLRRELTTILGPERFRREVAIASGLKHRNIIPCLDSGEVAGFLFYVMPLVSGETLQQRIAREGPLPIDEAVSVARQIAAGVAVAHAAGIVHRDLKPPNVLLEGDRAMVADFGLARAFASADVVESLTSSGLVVGTPAYMSPEQANGDANVDARSDVYALGCVMFEILAGEPPFTGHNPMAVLARHSTQEPPRLRGVRSAVPPGLEAIVLKCLSKMPIDRFKSASELAAALEGPLEGTPPTKRRPLAIGLGLLAVLALVRLVFVVADGPRASSNDSTVVAVLPFEGISAGPVETLVRQGLGRFSAVDLVDSVRSAEAAMATKAPRDWPRLASRLKAGRLVFGSVSPAGDSTVVTARLVAGGSETVLETITVAARGPTDLPRAAAQLVDRLLVRPRATRLGSSTPATSSLSARGRFEEARVAVESWNLESADSAFGRAIAADPGFEAAQLWQALVRYWGGADPASWRPVVERLSTSAQLDGGDRHRADALLSFVRGQLAESCTAWRRLATADSADFVSWFSLGKCLAGDNAVIRSGASAGGWRFRSSYQLAIEAFRRAFRLLPSVHRGFGDDAFARLRRTLLIGDASWFRMGKALAPDTLTFVAKPAVRGDSLVWIPVRLRAIPELSLGATPAETEAGLVRLRQIFFEIASEWVAAYPSSPEALEALGIARELIGDRNAVETVRKARSLAINPTQRIRLATLEIWHTLRGAIPDDTIGLLTVRRMADSILALPVGQATPPVALAAMTGRADLAARLSRNPAIASRWQLSPALRETMPALAMYAVLGGPADSIRRLGERTIEAIRLGIQPEARDAVEREVIGRVASLVFPEPLIDAAAAPGAAADFLVNAELRMAKGDSGPARRLIRDLKRMGESDRAPSFDGLIGEVSLLVALGDTAAAVRWLDQAFGGLETGSLSSFEDDLQGPALVRAALVRAELAKALGDVPAARRWGRVVRILWGGGDEFIRVRLGGVP